jgi:NAD(P)-dependent dehydrogenase (short-subunit alcohol dehydrogenase family)
MVVTGAARGLGRALAEEGIARGARVALVDLDAEAVRSTASEIGGIGIAADVGSAEEIRRVIAVATDHLGPVDIWCSNAALSRAADLEDIADAWWDAAWHVNVMAHVWAARELLPAWVQRGRGCLFQTVSAVALTLNHWDAPYATTKRAALAFNEYLATRYGPAGIVVSAFCPRGMLTDRLKASMDRASPAARNAMNTAVTPERAAQLALDGVEAERFLILTESDEIDSHRKKAEDLDGWILRRRQQVIDERPSKSVPPD